MFTGGIWFECRTTLTTILRMCLYSPIYVEHILQENVMPCAMFIMIYFHILHENAHSRIQTRLQTICVGSMHSS